MSEPEDELPIQYSFNYELLDPVQRATILQQTKEIKSRLRRAAQDIWEVGQKLVEVRSCLKHGQFEVWLRAEFGWSHRTAYNFINVYEAFGEAANFAKLDIAASALYLLAAPSTPQSERDEFFQQAKAGEKITYKSVQKKLRDAKLKLAPEPSRASSSFASRKAEILAVLPNNLITIEAQTMDTAKTALPPVEEALDIQPGWYQLGEGPHWLFCGDTASPQFSEQVPQVILALAITSSDWDHDWLVDTARSVVILPEADLRENFVEQLMSMLTLPGDLVVFPWLPSADMIAIAHRLGRQVFAGDPDPKRCSKALKRLGLSFQKTNPSFK
jgi:hypothetical protein